MNKIIDSIKNAYNSPFKPIIRTILVCIGLILVVWIGANSYNFIKEVTTSKSPVVSIKATNKKVYLADEQISVNDFDIKAVHKNGDTSSIDNKEVKLSTKTLKLTGETTPVTLTYKDKYECTVDIKNDRKEVASVDCGKYDIESVRAVVYSNGELAFEGEGDIRQFHEKAAPWYTMETNDVAIKAVSFQDTVTPKNLDYFFEDFSDLQYIENIPTSVESAYKMCYRCINLQEGPDFSECENLLNLNQAFEGCTSMEKPAILPPNLTSAVACYKDCILLNNIGNLSYCDKLKVSVEMFSGCENILEADFSKGIQMADSMYAGCINLEKSNSLPDSIKHINYMFKDAISLKTVPNIPASVESASNTFAGCRKLEGEMVIDGVPRTYSSFFTGACEGKKLNLTGSSPMLEVLANTSKSGNITVNGNAPAPNKTSFNFYNYQQSLNEAANTEDTTSEETSVE